MRLVRRPIVVPGIFWTGAAAVDIYLDTDGTATPNLGPIALTANPGQASPGCPGVAGAYNFYAGALQGGTYRVFVTTAGAACSAGTAKYARAWHWVVNDAPTLAFTRPPRRGATTTSPRRSSAIPGT